MALNRAVAALGALIMLAQPAAAATLPQVIDGHADFALHYLRKGWSVEALDIEKSLPGQADVPRWRAGGINGAIATVGSDKPPGSDLHFPRVAASLDWFDALVKRHSSLVAARSAGVSAVRNDRKRTSGLCRAIL